MLETVGRMLEHGSHLVKAITFDAHGSHSIVRKLLHGQAGNIDVSALPFWNKLSWRPLPETCLPRLPIQTCVLDQEVVYGIPGVCHLTGLRCQHFVLVFIS